jgi:adenylate cyclase
LILNIIYPISTAILSFFSLTGLYYFIESKEKRKIKHVFSKYVTKHVVDELLKHEHPKLGGERREISVLFSDIRGFTAMSEKMKPEDVVSMLNHYFKDMVEIVFRHEGTMDKYIGDAIMASWNTPVEQKDHLMRAVKTALEMQEKLHKDAKHPFGVGIGVHTGEAVVGNIGSEQRLEFTSIGDTVNTASRLCSKAEGGQVLIDEKTYSKIKDQVVAKKIGKIEVKGKAKPLIIYEVIKLK